MKPISLENITSKPVAERADYLLNDCKENQWFERKGIKIAMNSIARPIIALANAEGGIIVLGASNGKIEGVRYRPKITNDLPQAIYDYIRPPINVSIDLIDIIADDGLPDKIIILTVAPSDTVHEDNRQRCFLRIGDESRELNHYERLELEYNKGVRQYDGELIKGSNTRDLDANLLMEYAKNVGSKRKNPINVLKARFLIDKQGQQTNACHLLF